MRVYTLPSEQMSIDLERIVTIDNNLDLGYVTVRLELVAPEGGLYSFQVAGNDGKALLAAYKKQRK